MSEPKPRPYGVYVRDHLPLPPSASAIARRRDHLIAIARKRLFREGFRQEPASVNWWMTHLRPTPAGETPDFQDAELSMTAWGDPEATHLGVHVRLVVER